MEENTEKKDQKDKQEQEECDGTKSCASCGSCSGGNDAAVENDAAEDDNDDDKELSRAQFIRGAFGLTVLCWSGVAAAPILMYLSPPPVEDEKTKVTSIEVCKVSELPKGTGKNFRFGSVPALVIHTEDDQFHAFKAICTHLGCTVQFRADKKCIYCACHGGEYDAETGKNVAGPPPKPLASLKAEVVDGKVIVSRA